MAPEPPGHHLGGGDIRLAHLFEALAAAIPTDLWTVGKLDDDEVRDAAAGVVELPRRRVPWSQRTSVRRLLQVGLALGSRYPAHHYQAGPARRALARELRSRHEAYNLVVVEHEAMAALLPRRRSAPWAIDLQNLASRTLEQEIARAQRSRQRGLLKIERRKALAVERRIARSFDRVLVCSEMDAEVLRGLEPAAAERIAVIPNGADLARYRVTPIPVSPRILFPSHLAYWPNVDGALWFCSEVLPRLRAAVPEAEVQLVGRAPVAEVLALGELPGVSVHADVPSMVPYFEPARLVVVPLRIGSGTRLKALEAMASGRPLVGTTIGLEGIGIVDHEHALVADDPDSMAGAIRELLADDALCSRLASAARAHVERYFSWEAIGAQMVGVMDDLLGDRRAP